MEQLSKRIKEKTRDEWKNFGRAKSLDLRIWVQEHGEMSFLAGIVLGALVVFFPYLVLILLVLAALTALVVWLVAEEKTDSSCACGGDGEGCKSSDPVEVEVVEEKAEEETE